MDRNQAKEFYPILKAYAEGRVIECRTKSSAMKGTYVPNDWTKMKEIEFWNNTEYRIKPEPKYRPFNDAEECWAEMQKHQPLGFTKFKNRKSGYYMVTFIASGVIVGMNNTPFSYENMFDSYAFADGTPFGIKEEE
jgi:hypothetical protein|nr:MAG TPA: hypothetical protein [Caudoviricetes sp.]